MSATSGASARQRVRVFFLAYFLFVGTQSPYLSLYLSEVGMSIAQIGLLLSLSPVSRLVGPLFWGGLAERSGARVAVLVKSAWMGVFALVGMGLCGLFDEPGLRLAALSVLCALMYFASSAQIPLAESIALEAAGRDASRYSRMRVWGSIGFIVGVMATGPLFEFTGMASLPWWLAAMMAGVLVSARRLPAASIAARKPGAGSAWQRLREPSVLAFFASVFLMGYAHSAFYAFFSLFLEMHGYSKTAIGLIWSIGVIAEIVMFYVQRPLFVRHSALTLLGLSIVVSVLRFGLVGWSAGALWLIVFTQLMHAITYGLHLTASQSLLQRWFEPTQQASAQAMFVTVGYGLGGTLGGLGASWVWVSISPAATFFGSSIAALFGLAAVYRCARAQAPDRACAAARTPR